MPAAASFDQAIALSSHGSGRYGWDVPHGWQQGRGAWGGLTIGAIISAVVAEQADSSMRVRSLTCEIPMPVLVGHHDIVVAATRIGSSTAHWSAEVIDAEGQVRAAGSVVTATDRDATATVKAGVAPRVRAGRDAYEVPEAFSLPVPPGPAFATHLRYRPASGLPLAGTSESTSGWVSFAQPPAWTAASLLALVDGWWPVALVAETDLRPMATVMFAATLCLDPSDLVGLDEVWFEGEVVAVDGAFTTESRRLWSPDGRVVVENLQSIVVIA